MVGKNFIVYVNEKHAIRVAPLGLTYENDRYNFSYTIPEKNLVCGLILDGKPIKGDRLKLFPFKPIEKYLFEFSNIHFIIPDMEFNQEKVNVSFSLKDLEDIVPKIQFWGAGASWVLGESINLNYNAATNNELNNFTYNYIYLHVSYDAINFAKFDIFNISFQNYGETDYQTGSNNVDFQNGVLEELGETMLPYDITTLPKYFYFSNELGHQTPILPIGMP